MKLTGIILVVACLAMCNKNKTQLNSVAVTKSNTNNPAGISSHTFFGIDSITSITDTAATINWTHNANFSAYQIFNVTSGTSYVSTVSPPTASYNLTGLSIETTYSFKVRAMDSEGNIDNNTNNISFTTSLNPYIPSGLILNDPSSSSGLDQTPTITVTGIKSGDTIKLFTDPSCSTQVGSAVSSGSTVNITTSTLTVGSYSFYANATGVNSSACSTANVSYAV